jgi:hypothetical protein
MRIVIQCANTKADDAGWLRAANGVLSPSGEPISFVARPNEARAANLAGNFARPDDSATTEGRSWRHLLVEYNATGANPLRLAQAARLYRHHAYSDLVDKFGLERVFILSAGWGLVRGAFLLPSYDITFSSAAESYLRRRQHDQWPDFCHLEDTGEAVVFFGGRDYLPLFRRLTHGFSSPRTIYYQSVTSPDAPGCNLVRFPTTARTNWHYCCVAAFLSGRVNPCACAS